MMSAISAAKCGHKVTLIERNNKVGKLYITGKGRCNVTNKKTIENFLKMYLQIRSFCIVRYILLQMKIL